ncbi:MAG: tRNA (adenosine(37)-N6)-threonylcarbamoyltransferase complex transferase subunit TsaD [Polyangiaceae bacterium]|nr:tRNA (adenosine(37)-N6)-threonylcarbamoyltransferase complex transferase subunit TsaD [Polyangiaceae bacterium]
MLVLGIETSCDETAAAVVRSDGLVLSDVVHSQVSLHAPYGGVVPELASRDHLRNAAPVVQAALDRAGVGLDAVGGVAVTCRPGLSGALLVGVQLARGIAWSRGLPLVGVDHLLGHLAAPFLRWDDAPPLADPLPFVALLVSGGHTALYRVDALEAAQVHELGATRDDAAGEAFDKVAKLLGLGYPGGPIVDRLAREGDPAVVPLTRPMRARDSLELSFSGLKTQVARWIEADGLPGDDRRLRDLCAAFQGRVIDALLAKLLEAVRREGVRTVLIAGGVAANRELRARAAAACERRGLRLIVPAPRACTDNGAMIAYAGSLRLVAGEDDGAAVAVNPRTCLERRTRKGGGRR